MSLCSKWVWQYVEMQCSLQKWLGEGCSYTMVFLERRTQVLRWPPQPGQVTGRWRRLHGGYSFLQSFCPICSWVFLLKSSVPFKFITYLIRPALGWPCFPLLILSQAPRQTGIILPLKPRPISECFFFALPSQPPSTVWVRPHTWPWSHTLVTLLSSRYGRYYLRNHYKDLWWSINSDRP